MAKTYYMKFDIQKLIEDAQEPENDRKATSVFVSTAKIKRFRENCEKIKVSNSKMLEVFMDQFSEYVESKKK